MIERARLRVYFAGWPFDETAERQPAPFRCSWTQVLNDLEGELALWGEYDAKVLRCETHPGIRLLTAGLHLACDTYCDSPSARGMSANLRAITRTLGAHRQINRDGVRVDSRTHTAVGPGS